MRFTFQYKKDKRNVYPFFISVFLGFALLSIGLISCERSDDNSSCKLLSYSAATLWYDEITGPLTFNPSFDGYIYPEYQGTKIVKVHGGLIYSQPTSMYYFEPLVEDRVEYHGDTISVSVNANTTDRPVVNSYIIEDGKLIFRRYQSGTIGAEPVDYTYQYSGDVITEFSFGHIYRKFYLTNGNLTKVERPLYDLSWQPTGEQQWTYFSNYNTGENQLKGKFYLQGAFYTAFSTNNFSAINRAFFDGVQETPAFSLSFVPPADEDLFNRSCD